MANRTLFSLIPIGDTKFVREIMLTECDQDELRIHTNEATEMGDGMVRTDIKLTVMKSEITPYRSDSLS
jgi:hypothetical protein